MLGYDNTFNDDFRIFEKNRFFEIQKLAKRQKIEDFTKNSCLNQRVVLLGRSPSGGAASVCLLSMMCLVGASRLSSLYLRFICFSPDVRCHGIRGAQAWVSIL